MTVYPLVWMLLSSFKTNREIYQPDILLPESLDPFAYRLLFFSGEFIDFYEVLTRSILLAGGQALLATFCNSRGWLCIGQVQIYRKIPPLFTALLVILYPRQAISLSLFEWMAKMGMSGSYYGLLFSGVASGLGVIFFMGIVKSLTN